MSELIDMEDCKDGWTYKINARNMDIGIWNSEDKYFNISRIKFNDNFIFPEYHWDSFKIVE